jgi:ABC-type Fe3+-siderophore transport system permease subunit
MNRMMLWSRQFDQSPASLVRSSLIRRALCVLLVIWFVFATAPATTLFAQGDVPPQDEPLVSQTIGYRIDDASEVFLVWGINGWTTISEKPQPAGTVVRDGLMFTPMVLTNGVFIAKIQVPLGATIDYAFQITKTGAGATINVWDANGDPGRDYHTYAVENGIVEFEPTEAIARQVNPNFVNTRLLWNAIVVVVGVGLIVAVLLLRRITRNPYLDF